MNTIAAFFASIIALVSGFLGYTSPFAAVQQPVSETRQVTSTSSAVASTTQVAVTVTATQELVSTSSQSTLASIFVDPESRYRVSIPANMLYQYDKDSKSLSIWNKKVNGKAVDFSISYVSRESQKDTQDGFSDAEKSRNVALKTGEIVSIYNPYITEACHEVGYLALKDKSMLGFYNSCGNPESRALFDKIIGGVEITLVPTLIQLSTKVIWYDKKFEYTSNKGYIYLNGVKIDDADSNFFQVVTQDPFPTYPNSDHGIVHYSKDKNNVFYDGKVIKDADSSSFRVVWPNAMGTEQIYAKDKNNVYYMGTVLTPKANPNSFLPLDALWAGWRVGGAYSQDSNRVYYKSLEVEGADINTFNPEYEDNYAADKDHVYLEGKLVLGADPKTFKFPTNEP